MRDYAKVSPQFWIGATGKALRSAGMEAQIVAMYLMTCPHANMLGLFYMPQLFIAHETGLGMEGASKGLARACEAGFCSYDEASEVVWVHEMAAYQIADELKPDDKRCKGVQNEYEALPDNLWLVPFYDRYGTCFHMSKKRGTKPKKARATEAPSKPLRSQEQEQEQEQETEQEQAHEQFPAPQSDATPINVETWKAYKLAYVGRYGVDPVRNAAVNTQIKRFVERLGVEAPAVADFYLRSNKAYYVQQSHSAAAMLKDAEGLRTQWATGRTVTQTQALQADKSQARGNVFLELIEEARNAEAA